MADIEQLDQQESPLDQPTEEESRSFFSSFRSRKAIVLLGGVLIVIILLTSLLFISNKSKPAAPIARPTSFVLSPTPLTISVMQIGDDFFSQSDLDYLAKVYTPGKEAEKLSPTDKEKLFNIALEHSIVIQEAKKNNLISVDDSIFSPNKDWRQYNKAFQQAKEAIIAQEEQISVAGIFIFFYNQFPPDMGVEAAKTLTRGKMEAIHQKLVSGEINLKQAAEMIKSDSSLSEIDPIWDKNAYAEFRNRNRSRQIVGGISSADNDLLWSLDVGQYSPIILGYETGNLPEPNEAYWAIFQVIEKKGTGKPYLEWLEEAKGKYAIQNL